MIKPVLIDKPNCGLNCPRDWVFGCCRECGSLDGHFEKGERERRFTVEEIKKINALKTDDEFGFLGKDGCKIASELGREFMPETCLKFKCNPNMTRTKVYF